MMLRNLSHHLTVMLQVVDDGVVANPYMKTGNEFTLVTSGEIVDPEIYNGIKDIKHKEDS